MFRIKSIVKRFLVFLAVIFPVLIIFFVGIPLLSTKFASEGTSERCYSIGHLASYISCIKSGSEDLKGLGFFNHTFNSLNSLFFPYGYLFLAAFFLSICAIAYINIIQNENN